MEEAQLGDELRPLLISLTLSLALTLALTLTLSLSLSLALAPTLTLILTPTLTLTRWLAPRTARAGSFTPTAVLQLATSATAGLQLVTMHRLAATSAHLRARAAAPPWTGAFRTPTSPTPTSRNRSNRASA